MEILVTNDDGWGSKGILTLARLMTQLGHVTVVAPEEPQSGMGNAISVQQYLYLRPLDNPKWGEKSWQKKVDVYTTNGTPSDCIKMALNILYEGDDSRCDLVASGINHGSNTSINVIYSGTMGACFVAAEHGIPAIGFSLCAHGEDLDFRNFEPYVVEIARNIIQKSVPYGICYNVNAPIGEIQDVRWTRQACGHWEREMEKCVDEYGAEFYHLVGEFVNHEPDAEDTDEWAVQHGCISIQPCTIDRTAYEQV